VSADPPAENGTTSLIVLVGHSCACEMQIEQTSAVMAIVNPLSITRSKP
jgi:hypothetical protein